MGYESIPMELRLRDQWVCAAQDKVPLNPKTGLPASTTDPSTWGSFQQACDAGYKHIGFVFSKDDPYAGLDLDNPMVKKVGGATIPNENAEEVATIKKLHEQICNKVNSYTELSTSGLGIHIIVYGKVPKGVRRDCVEIYSEGRYFIFSGNVLNFSPIADYQEFLDSMYADMSTGTFQTELVEVSSPLNDDAILQMATAATNNEKFNHLWQGNINGYVSQSEADFALISMLGFYSPSNGQVRRLFRLSNLGQRDKANKNDDYIDRSLAKIRGRQESVPVVDISELLNKYLPSPAPLLLSPPLPLQVQIISEPEIEVAEPVIKPSSSVFPPGLIGEMADYIYSSATRPIIEVGLTMAIAMGSGFLGRQFNISSTGFNQYVILVGNSGVGKEGGADGVDSLLNVVRVQIPQVDDFVGPAVFASGQAFIKSLEKSNNFFSIFGEVGHTFKQICDPRASSHEVQFRKVLLDLYMKSGSNRYLRPSVYSDKEKNTGMVKAPCVSFWGDTTPEILYDSFDASHIAQGLISRLLVVPYLGKRPPQNMSAFHAPSEHLKQLLVTYFQGILAMKYNDQFCAVPMDADGRKLMNAFDVYCDDEINEGEDEITRQLWTRGHLKALKLAGLVAVGCNMHRPVVTKEIAEWAIALAIADVKGMVAKFTTGEMGNGDHKCESDIMAAVNRYPSLTEKQRAAYNVPAVLRNMPLALPFVYLKKYCAMRTSFKNDRRGAVVALDVALKDLLKAGILQQIPAPTVKTQWNIDSPVFYRGESWQ